MRGNPSKNTKIVDKNMSNSLIRMRPYQDDVDLQLILDLFDACEKVDRLEMSVSIAQLRLMIEAPGIDRERDLSLWEDVNGQLIGFGELTMLEPTSESLADGSLWFFAHPIARGGDLETQIIDWAESRMKDVGRERQGQPKLFTWGRNTRTDRIITIEQHGFVESRQFLFLTKALTETIPKPQLPADFIIHAVDAKLEARSWVDLHNQSFINTWNYHPLTVESYQRRLQDPDYLTELDLVAISQTEGSTNDPDGKFASICQCIIDRTHNTFVNRQEGWVALLFTHPDFQRRGLARAMLLHGLNRLKAHNMDIAKIGVDAQNPFGARKLYESVGFEHLYTSIAYVKRL
jgi:mycothiol synthase